MGHEIKFYLVQGNDYESVSNALPSASKSADLWSINHLNVNLKLLGVMIDSKLIFELQIGYTKQDSFSTYLMMGVLRSLD